MKKNPMKEVNNFESEFDKFIGNDHTEFLCNLTGALLAVASIVSVVIGQYSKHIKDENENDEE